MSDDSTGDRPSRRRAAGRPSLLEVARLAGVSPQTASRVANASASVRPQTRDRVLAAMSQLGYSPNSAARALRVGSYGTIGVIAHQLHRTGESLTVQAIVEAARGENYTVSLVGVRTPSSSDVNAAVLRLAHQSIDGLVIIRAEDDTPATLGTPPGLPIAVSDSHFVGHHPVVSTDHRSGSRLAVEHLLGLGHRTVHHLAGPEHSGSATERTEAWRDTLRSAGRTVHPPLMGDWSSKSGYETGLRIAADPEITAVFAANDEMAIGVMSALADSGVSVPHEVSVIGFDGIPLAEYFRPALTTVRQDFDEIGRTLVDFLVRQIRDGVMLVDEHHLVPARLIERASTARSSRRR